jgi:hypothetical protein
MPEENANGTNESQQTPSTEASVPRADYEKLLVEAATAKEKASLFDDLLKDPEFLTFLEKEDSVPATAVKASAAAQPSGSADVQALKSQIEELSSKLENLGKAYSSDKEAFMRMESNKLIDTMSTDKENYPFFNDKEVRESMATLLEQGRASNMIDAYRLSTFDRAEAQGRNKVINKKGAVTLPIGQRMGTPLPASGGKRELKDILGDALDKTGVVLTEGE